jgi:3-methyladenine DNA glycosylase AlkD
MEVQDTRIEITQELRRQGSREKAEWWNHYLKGEIPFIGVSTPGIRKVVLERDRKYAFGRLPMNRQVALVNGLIRGDFAEEKLAAILYVQLFWLDSQKPRFLMNLISDWFDDRNIYDWNTTDWLSIRILAPLVDSGDQEVIWKLKRWNRDPSLWKARASIVPFARVSSITDHAAVIDRFADILIRRQERYAKTAVGWVLREFSKHDPEFVLDFLSRHVKYTTAEVKRNALKYYRKGSRNRRG